MTDIIFTHHLLFFSSSDIATRQHSVASFTSGFASVYRQRRPNSLTISIGCDDRSSIHSVKSTPPNSDSSSSSPLSIDHLDEIKKRKLILQNFAYTHEDDRGSLRIRLMSSGEVDQTCVLIADSIPESSTLSRWNFKRYVRIYIYYLFFFRLGQYLIDLSYRNVTELEFLVKQYLDNQRTVFPHSATLVGFYKQKNNNPGEEEEKVACTVEISFNALGMHSFPSTPLPPRDHPYICNMVVKRELRRKGIGWHLLMACEKLTSLIFSSDNNPHPQAPTVYLHCRVVNLGALSMYKKAGYTVVKTDNILVWLSFHRRKTLMFKKLEQ